MTDEIRNNLIEKMIDRPTDLSPDEIEAVMGDAELRDFYEISVDLQNSLIEEPQINIKEEWGNFRQLLSARRRRLSLKAIMQIAAIFIGIALLSGVVLNIINSQSSQSSVAGMLADVQRTNDTCGIYIAPKTTTIATPKPTTSTPSEQSKSQQIATKNMSSATVVPIATASASTIDTPINPHAVDAPDDFDPDQYVRVQQARIDNEIAMAMAERYLTEYNLKQKTEVGQTSSPDDEADLKELNRITML